MNNIAKDDSFSTTVGDSGNPNQDSISVSNQVARLSNILNTPQNSIDTEDYKKVWTWTTMKNLKLWSSQILSSYKNVILHFYTLLK